MRHLIIAVILLTPGLITAQCVVEVSNVQCTDDPADINFELTMTDNGNPVTISNTFHNITFDAESGPSDLDNSDNLLSIGIQNISSDFSEVTNLMISNSDPNISVSFENGATCSDIVGQVLRLDIIPFFGSSCYTFGTDPPEIYAEFPSPETPEMPTAPLPNMSQWALIILGLGVVSTAVLLLIRSGKLDSIQ